MLHLSAMACMGHFDSSLHADPNFRLNLQHDVPAFRQTRQFVVLGWFTVNGIRKSHTTARPCVVITFVDKLRLTLAAFSFWSSAVISAPLARSVINCSESKPSLMLVVSTSTSTRNQWVPERES